jgi:integrase
MTSKDPSRSAGKVDFASSSTCKIRTLPSVLPQKPGNFRVDEPRPAQVKAGQQAGLDRLEPPVAVTLHILRHTYLYMLRKAGVSAEMAGHSLETTMKYGSPKIEEKQRAADLLDHAVTI